MYRCVQCEQPIPYLRIATATPAFPAVCGACGAELVHPLSSRRGTWAFGGLVLATVGVSVLLDWPIEAAGVALAAILAWMEWRWYKRGRPRLASKQMKRVSRIAMEVTAVSAAALLLFELTT